MPDDAAAQLNLRAALERLEAAPFAFLGLAADPTPEQARGAFLRLTKQYHPAKFARFSPETVRLANEVFLALKRVCEGLGRPASGRSVAVAPRAARPSPVQPVVAAAPVARREPSGRTPPVGSPSPAARPSASAAPSASGPIPRPVSSTRPMPFAAPAPGGGRSVVAGGPSPAAAASRAVPTAGHPHAGRTTPMRGIPQTGRAPKLPNPSARAAAAPADSAAPAMPTSSGTRIPRLDVGDNERGHFEQGLELLRRRMWSDGERLFAQLSIAVPTDRRYRAYRDYARGRIAQDLGRHDEARTEWQRALALDPTLMAAKAALEQLPEPEPTKPTGLLGKIFRR